MESSPKRPSLLDRALNVVAEVKAGEGLSALLLMMSVFMILSSYYVLKTVRQGLILAGGTHLPFIGEIKGADLQIAAGGAMALLMLLIVPAYGSLASRVPRKRLLDLSYAIVIGCLAVFFLLGGLDVPVALPFFIWLGIISMFLIAQFWSYANDLYTEEQGKRLFSIIAIGGTAGAIVGPKLTGLADVFGMMGIAAGMLVAVIVLLGIVEKIARADTKKEAEASLAKDGGFQLVLRDRYLFLIGVMLVLANLVNTTGEFILSDAAASYAEQLVPTAADKDALEKARGAVVKDFYGDFFFYVNLVGFLIQTLLTSRIIKYMGVRGALFVFPAIAMASYGTIGLIGGLTMLRIAKIAENSTDYSLQNTVRQSLFLPTSREVKYKAKAAIDTFFVRFGDTAAAVLVLLGTKTLGLSGSDLAFANMGVVAVWLLVASGIARRHKILEDKKR